MRHNETAIECMEHTGNYSTGAKCHGTKSAEFNTNQNLFEWSERIRECRVSGMQVKDWCESNGITVSTYYKQQRKVFDAAKRQARTAPQFVEISPAVSSGTPAATIRIGGAEVDIYPGADEGTIQAILRVLKSC